MKIIKPTVTVIELDVKEINLIIKMIKYCQSINIFEDIEIIIAEEMLTELNMF
jgi:hypothetical protein